MKTTSQHLCCLRDVIACLDFVGSEAKIGQTRGKFILIERSTGACNGSHHWRPGLDSLVVLVKHTEDSLRVFVSHHICYICMATLISVPFSPSFLGKMAKMPTLRQAVDPGYASWPPRSTLGAGGGFYL